MLISLWDAKGNCAKGKSEEARRLNRELENIKVRIGKHYQYICDHDTFVTAKKVYDRYTGLGEEIHSLVELNRYIDALRVKFYQIYQDLELEGKIISARAIVNRYQGKDETFKTLYNVFKEHNDNCRKLIGTDYADITVRRYDNCLKYLMELVKRDYKVDDMLLREVNGELVRDVFIFCVYTGLAFIDVYNLRPEHVSEDSNGNLWIVKPREKTNNLCNIPLLSIPKQILEKYKDNPYCMDKGTLLPVPCNQKMNSHRKRLKSIFLYKSSTSTLVI